MNNKKKITELYPEIFQDRTAIEKEKESGVERKGKVKDGFLNLKTWLLKQFVVFCFEDFEIVEDHHRVASHNEAR